jgi:predicted DNA binding CopG/RHH family protein/uncharacterized DUF497 family protein
MKYFSWDPEKSAKHEQERGVTFEAVVFHIERGDVLDILEHPNQEPYGGQRMFAVAIENCAYLVPSIETDTEVFLKTIIPSRKATRKYLRSGPMGERDTEEKEILDSYDRDEWAPSPRRDEELEKYQGYARATFRKDRRVNIRISGKDLEALQKKALREGIPYQTLIASILHKYVSGSLAEKQP